MCHVHFRCPAIANYLYRANNNLRKDLGKVKGLLRWKFYQNKIDKIVTNNLLTLQALVHASRDSNLEPSRTAVNELRVQLTNECARNRSGTSDNEDMENRDNDTFSVVTKFIERVDMNDFPNWKISINSEDGTNHLYYFGAISSGYCQLEVIINNEGFWKVCHKGRERSGVTLDWANVSNEIDSVQELKKLMSTIQSLKICSGFSIDNYETLSQDHALPVYYTRNGEPAAFVESSPSQCHKKFIRSTNCLLFIQYDETLGTTEICAACQHSKHYMRTLKSRLNCQDQKEEKSKFT